MQLLISFVNIISHFPARDKPKTAQTRAPAGGKTDIPDISLQTAIPSPRFHEQNANRKKSAGARIPRRPAADAAEAGSGRRRGRQPAPINFSPEVIDFSAEICYNNR